MLFPDVSSPRETLILSKQLERLFLFSYSLPSFICFIWAWQPAALDRKVLEEGRQRVCLQPDEPGFPSCHGVLGKPFTDLAGFGGLPRHP